MTNMITSPQINSTIDPTQGLVDYVQTIKPYHTKILSVWTDYVYTDSIVVTIQDRCVLNPDMLANPADGLTATTIGDTMVVDIELVLRDSIAVTITNIAPTGFGVDLFSNGQYGLYGSSDSAGGFIVTVAGSTQGSGESFVPDDGTIGTFSMPGSAAAAIAADQAAIMILWPSAVVIGNTIYYGPGNIDSRTYTTTVI